jgi:hypothetical protein
MEFRNPLFSLQCELEEDVVREGTSKLVKLHAGPLSCVYICVFVCMCVFLLSCRNLLRHYRLGLLYLVQSLALNALR